MTKLNIYLPPQLLAKLREKASAKGISLAELIRQALLATFDHEKEHEKESKNEQKAD